MNNYEKYIKYKKKYLELKKELIIGGSGLVKQRPSKSLQSLFDDLILRVDDLMLLIDDHNLYK
jgi:hypothetical protein